MKRATLVHGLSLVLACAGGASLSAWITVAALRDGGREERRVNELLESRDGHDASSLRRLLVKEAYETIAEIEAKFPQDSLCVANCRVASSLVGSSYGDRDAPPFVIFACAQRFPNGLLGLVFYPLNLHRETTETTFGCAIPEDRMLWIRIPVRSRYKVDSLLAPFGSRVKIVGLEELLRQATRMPSGDMCLSLDTYSGLVIPIPDKGGEVVVGVKDRNGRSSNFVPVRGIEKLRREANGEINQE